MESLSAYIPEDRRQAMALGRTLPDRATGAALFADLSGFTPMTEALTRAYGPHRGAEELTRQLGLVFGELIRQVDDHRGAVIGFSGDAITCWFDGDDGLRATTASLAMQAAMVHFADIPLSGGERATLQVKTAVVIGPVRRFLVGHPELQVIDVVAGATLDLLAEAERCTESGEVVVSRDVALALGDRLIVRAWREGERDGRRFAVVERLDAIVERDAWPPQGGDALTEDLVRSWVMPGVFERLQQGLSTFLADFRPATALFLSFVGIDYDDDPDAGTRLDAFVRWVQRRIAAHEGSLIQLTIGDKGSSYLYAAFGAPIAHHDTAARAVAVALEIQAPPAEFGYVRDIRIGVTHGQMYAGAYGSTTRRTYGVLGAKTNLSARLMGKAAAGQILCDEDVARRAGKVFAFASLGSLQVKGKRESVAVFTPGNRIVRGGQDPANASDDPLVGRVTDLAALEGSLADAVEGPARVTFLEGEAGIGKSRVVAALVALGRERGAVVLAGAGQSGAQQMPYRAWRDAFSGFFGLHEGQGTAERHERVSSIVRSAVPGLHASLPLLNDLLPLDLPETSATTALEPAARQEALVELLVALLGTLSERSPLVIVLEDAHWLDSLSWDLAARVAQAFASSSTRAWLLIVHRPLEEPHLGERAMAALQGLPRSEVTRLGALDHDDLVGLVALRLGLPAGGVPHEVASLMRDRASGNPFIAEELLQTLQDQELITIVDDGEGRRCRVSPELARGRFSLPDTLQGLILSRIDRLPADRQLVLKVASVIGRRFTVTPLRDTLARLGWAERGVRPALLRELTRGGFVVPDGLERELRYLFRHVITHEVVYGTLLFAQRRQVHQRVAEWFEATEETPGRDLAPVLAHHWSRAAEGSEDAHLLEKAITYLKLAGGHAAQLGAFPEALARFERGLALLPETATWGPARAAILIEIGAVHERTGEYAVASERLRHGLELSRLADDQAMASRALTVLGMIEQRLGNSPDAERYLEEAQTLIEGLDNPPQLARVWESLGLLSAQQGRFDRAIERLEAAYALHDELGNLDGVSATLNNLGIVAIFRTDFAGARGYFERALAIARDRGDREGVGLFLANLGYVAENLHDYEGAEGYLREALDIARELNARHSIYNTTVNLAHVALGQGRTDEAAEAYQVAYVGAWEIGALPVALEALCGLADLDLRAGDAVRAAERLGLILDHPAYNADVAHRAEPLLARLRELLPEDELARALAIGHERDAHDEAAPVDGAGSRAV